MDRVSRSAGERYDQASIDPDHPTLQIDEFEAMVLQGVRRTPIPRTRLRLTEPERVPRACVGPPTLCRTSHASVTCVTNHRVTGNTEVA